MRFSIHYAADYSYEGTAHEQHNALRLKPVELTTQHVESFELRTEPGGRRHRYRDYFGTEVIQFTIPARHEQMRIRAEIRVETKPPPEPGLDPDWEEYRKPAAQTAAEYLGLLEPAADPLAIAGLIAETRRATPRQTINAVCEMIPSRFTYCQGVTYVGSTVDDLLHGGAGVCQDFVHLGLTVLRGHGIPARYVSGYLWAVSEGSDERSAEVNTHAWLEAMLPGHDGTLAWIGLDPTNRKPAGAEHVKIGHGRAYSDVPPIRGVYRGPGQAAHEVKVTMNLLDDAADHGGG